MHDIPHDTHDDNISPSLRTQIRPNPRSKPRIYPIAFYKSCEIFGKIYARKRRMSKPVKLTDTLDHHGRRWRSDANQELITTAWS